MSKVFKIVMLLPVAFALTLGSFQLAYSSDEHRDDHQYNHEQHVWHQGERGYDQSYGAPFYGPAYYGTDYGRAPGVVIGVPGVGINIR